MSSGLFKPLLAATVETEEDYAKIQYPLLASPKVDGIRVICHPKLGVITRSCKAVPNNFARNYLTHPMMSGFDGEIVVGDPTAPNVFHVTQSAIMSQGGAPDFTYLVFDSLLPDSNAPYAGRYGTIIQRCADYAYETEQVGVPNRVRVLTHRRINNQDELQQYEEDCLLRGYEGIMLRHWNGKYKNNRSTLREGILLKLKRFMDAEARIIGWVPLMRNENEAFLDERGYQKRSAHQAGKIPDDSRIGAFVAVGINGDYDGVTFSCGSGLDDDQRLKLRAMVAADGKPGQLSNAVFTYKFQKYGSVDAPRAPIWKGLRPEIVWVE